LLDTSTVNEGNGGSGLRALTFNRAGRVAKVLEYETVVGGGQINPVDEGLAPARGAVEATLPTPPSMPPEKPTIGGVYVDDFARH